jgi:hypothetical protein
MWIRCPDWSLGIVDMGRRHGFNGVQRTRRVAVQTLWTGPFVRRWGP